jgi:hypothetical protein
MQLKELTTRTLAKVGWPAAETRGTSQTYVQYIREGKHAAVRTLTTKQASRQQQQRCQKQFGCLQFKNFRGNLRKTREIGEKIRKKYKIIAHFGRQLYVISIAIRLLGAKVTCPKVKVQSCRYFSPIFRCIFLVR